MLQRILQRLCGLTGSPGEARGRDSGGLDWRFGGMGEVVVGDLQVMFGGNRLEVPDPRANDVQGVCFGQLGFARCAKVLKEFRPRLEAGAPDNLRQLRSEVLGRLTIARDDELGPRLGLATRTATSAPARRSYGASLAACVASIAGMSAECA